jgi:hypothetical protein
MLTCAALCRTYHAVDIVDLARDAGMRQTGQKELVCSTIGLRPGRGGAQTPKIMKKGMTDKQKQHSADKMWGAREVGIRLITPERVAELVAAQVAARPGDVWRDAAAARGAGGCAAGARGVDFVCEAAGEGAAPAPQQRVDSVDSEEEEDVEEAAWSASESESDFSQESESDDEFAACLDQGADSDSDAEPASSGEGEPSTDVLAAAPRRCGGDASADAAVATALAEAPGHSTSTAVRHAMNGATVSNGARPVVHSVPGTGPLAARTSSNGGSVKPLPKSLSANGVALARKGGVVTLPKWAPWT